MPPEPLWEWAGGKFKQEGWRNIEALLVQGCNLVQTLGERRFGVVPDFIHFEGRNYSVGSANQMNKLSLVGMQHLFSGSRIPTNERLFYIKALSHYCISY
jgi:hypothetical protein